MKNTNIIIKAFPMVAILLMLAMFGSCQKDDEVIFVGNGSTSGTTGTENGYGYVDLGLSVKWATCNVGANNPEDYGDYFAWGETTTKDTYNLSTYKWCNGSYSTLTKYCNNSSYGNNGFTDNKTQLELSDDAARANWGGSWRCLLMQKCSN